MYYIFKQIAGLLKLDPVRIDNAIFNLHYKATTVLLVVFSALVCKKQYFGDPINCIVDIPQVATINKYCWIHSTYTLPELTGALVGEEVPHPGVANVDIAPGHSHRGQQRQFSVRHHKYYQWVVLCLFLQSVMFYMPRYMWKSWEGGRVRGLVHGLGVGVGDPQQRASRVSAAVRYFGRYFHHHNLYASQFFVCEMLNLVNVVGQIYFTDRFLDYGFLNYGPRVSQFGLRDGPVADGHDPRDEIFPKVAKCVFHKFGASGTIMRHDALCVLPLNILNEKIYAFLWFWLVAVTGLTVVGLTYRAATLLLPEFRHLLLRGRARLAAVDKIDSISRKCCIGDWFMLYLLAKNMDPFLFRQFIDELHDHLVDR